MKPLSKIQEGFLFCFEAILYWLDWNTEFQARQKEISYIWIFLNSVDLELALLYASCWIAHLFFSESR